MPLERSDAAEADDVGVVWRVDAAPARVWRCLTDADLLAQWWGELVEGAVVGDASFAVDHGDGYLCRSTVQTYDEPRRLTFTWQFPDEPPSSVDIELEERDEATIVRLAHRELGDLAAPYRDGWYVHLTYLEAAALGTPLPPSMFWRLHGTIAQLTAAR